MRHPCDVYVGVKDTGGELVGLPILDAAFDPRPGYENVIYVVPVLVVPPDFNPDLAKCAYKAAAKLELTGRGSYNLTELYGRNPADYSTITPGIGCISVIYDPDRQGQREIETDV